MVAIWRSAGASPRSWSQASNIIRRPEAPDRVAEGLEPAVGVHREVAVEVEGAGLDLLPRRAPLAEAEVLHQHQLGGREAVVHLGHGQLGPRVGDAGLRVGVLRRSATISGNVV